MNEIKTILCPVDFSEHSRSALDQAEELARALGAQLVMLHVVAPVLYPVAFGAAPLTTENFEERAKQAAEQELQKVVAEVSERGVPCSSLVGAGSPSQRIVELVKTNAIDLVVMATHGHTGLKHALLGSVAERVVRHCACPVLTVKVAG
ncbi:MAG: universal stress protein [Planctomycetota bacterium]|nr:MAG: universal stress protein [Planctomycetota bacterium]